MSYLYLASPYSHPDPKVREERFRLACRKSAEYLLGGISVFSPIAHSHPIADYLPEAMRLDIDLWMLADLPMLRFAKELHVLCIQGWDVSKGVAREIEYARQVGIPIVRVFP